MSVDDTDDERCPAGSCNSRVDDEGVINDINVWRASAMRELMTPVDDIDSRSLASNGDARVDDAGIGG